ncbi:MAG: AAA family ATPase [Acidimicrobiales bacterium]
MLSVLGAPRIERDGAAVTFDTRKATALLGYLAVTARAQRRETLAALLWPDADDTRARSALRRTLSVIKKELGDLGPTITRDQVELVDGDGISIDVRDFLAGVTSEDVETVARAAALWRGDLLAGFGLRDSPDFDDWHAREAERLRRAMSAACARLVDADAAAGKGADAIRHAERWLDLDPLHEPAHRALMRLHAQRDDRAAAVRQYRQCVRIVDEELGVAPLDETRALYEAISAGALGPPTAAPAEHPTAAVVGRYPFVGRDAELDQLRAAIGPGRVVVVEGEPGVGKTRLVEEALSRLDRPALVARCYDNDGDVPYGPLIDLLRLALADPVAGAALADLATPVALEAARLVPELAPVGADVSPAEGPGAEARFLDGIARAVVAAGSGAPGVIVLDDAQWADAATQQVVAHLAHRGGDDGPCLIVTHRTGEVGDAGPLAKALTDRLRGGSGVAIRLGRLSAAAVSALVAGAVPGEDSGRVTEDVVRESEGLPFLVVAYLDVHAGGETASSDIGDLLRGRLASLTDGASQLLTTASVIGRSFTFGVVRAASGRSDDEAVSGLDELVARGLVEERATPDEPTYDFTLGQVRQLVYDQTSLARRRLLHHRVAEALLGASGSAAHGASVAAAVAHHERQAGRDDLAAEHFRRAGDHARAVFANADARGHYEAALALGHPAVADLHEAVGDLDTLDGRFPDAVASFERAAARAGGDDASRIEGKLGGVHQRRGQWATAEQHYHEALRGLGDDGSLVDRARLTADLAITAHRRGDTEAAARLAAEAVSLAERAGDDAAFAHTGTVAGLLSASRGDLATAHTHLSASRARAVRLGDPAAQVAALNGLARVAWLGGDLGPAHDLLVEALGLCLSVGDRHREAALRDQLAQVLHGLGRHDEAMGELKRAVAIFADIGVEGGSIQAEVWRLSEWADHSPGPARNDPRTLAGDNGAVSDGAAARGPT